MARAFFEQVTDALVGFLPRDLRSFSSTRTGRNVKVWYGDSAREHYEVQIISRAPGRRGPVLEVGFHAEHPDAALNDGALARLPARAWRRALGRDAEAGSFIGRPSVWRRLSEVWDGPDLLSEEAASEAAERLALYIRTIEPLRAGPRATPPARRISPRATPGRGSAGRRSARR